MTLDETVLPPHSVFDEVLVFVRIGKIGAVYPETMPPKSSVPGMTFFSLSKCKSAYQYLKAHRKFSAEQWVEKIMGAIEKGRIPHEYAYNKVIKIHFSIDYSLGQLSSIYGYQKNA